MSDREPVTLIVLIDTQRQSWHAGAVGANGHPVPLIRSDDGNLDQYVGLEFDEQISFLRHRLAGVLQRSNDRMYARQMKANLFLFIADGDFPNADPGVTESLAEHFVQWMINPPVVYVRTPEQFAINSDADLEVIAGELPADTGVRAAVQQLAVQRSIADDWERIDRPKQ